MATYNKDLKFELIDPAGIVDLRDGYLLRAEIDAINSTENSADITLLDYCPYVDGHSVSDIKFWYHCEFSKGTLEDLEFGHMAFSVGDVVYIVLFPEQGDLSERMYIIGHVDIRGTNLCINEYVFFSMSGDGTISQRHFSLFDVSTGAELDLAAFVNKDELSPAAPLSFPCSWTTYSAWLLYNFSTVTPGTNVPLTITKKTVPDYIGLFDDEETSHSSSYPTAVDPAWYRYRQYYTPGGVDLYSVEAPYAEVSGFIGWTPTTHIALYSSAKHRSGSMALYKDIGLNLYDGVTHLTTNLVAETKDEIGIEVVMGQSGPASISFSRDWELNVSCAQVPSLATALSTSKSGVGVSCNLGEEVSIPYFETGSIGDYDNPSSDIFSARAVGNAGFYTVFSFPTYAIGYNKLSLVQSNQLESTRSEGFRLSQISSGLNPQIVTTSSATFNPNTLATVTRFFDIDGIDMSSDVSPILCMQNMDTDMSAALAAMAGELIQHIHTLYTIDNSPGINLSVYKKKTV